jgi:hypothetical protein
MPDADIVPVKFGNDRPLLFKPEPWRELGFAVPNFGDNVGTLSVPIHNLANEISRSQFYIMTHIDAQRTQPPSRNTIERIGKLLNRIKSILGTRQKASNEILTEPGHADPAMQIWVIRPCPYFDCGIVRNAWMREYNELCMIALTNMYQHSDNNRALTITAQFARDIYQYFREIKNLLGVELLQLPLADVQADNFMFKTEHYAAYAPETVVMNYEALDTPGPIEARFTEDDLRPLFIGIPATDMMSMVLQYPVAGVDGGSGYAGRGFAAVHAARGTIDGSLTGPPGGTIGFPTL